MEKTTVYLPADLKAGIKRLARQRNVSEAEVIRDSIRQTVGTERPKPTPGIFHSDPNIGLADASNGVLADRHGTRTIATLDRRHFDALRPLRGGRFSTLP
jgi:predicted transcriptional regulator